MGSSMSTVIPNIYMKYFEGTFKGTVTLKSTIWLRYVGDKCQGVEILMDHVNSIKPFDLIHNIRK